MSSFSVGNYSPTNSGILVEPQLTDSQSAPTADRSRGAEGSEQPSAVLPTPEDIQNVSKEYGEPAVLSGQAAATSSGNAPASELGRTPGNRNTETEALNQLDAKGEVDGKTQAKLFDKLSKPQTNSNGRKIAEQTEQEFTSLTGGMSDPDKAAVRKGVKNYAEDSSQINKVLRGKDDGSPEGAKGREANANGVLDAINKLQQAQGGDVSRVTYRLQSYKGEDGVSNPFGSKIKEGDTIQNSKINEGDTIQNQGIWSASQNRSFVKPDNPNAKSENHNVKFVIAGKAGVNAADPEGPYSNEAMGALKSGRFIKTPEPGQAEILYGPNTQFKVGKIQQAGPNETHVLLTVDHGNADGKPVKDAYTGDAI